jgi:hypothetical protein
VPDSSWDADPDAGVPPVGGIIHDGIIHDGVYTGSDPDGPATEATATGPDQTTAEFATHRDEPEFATYSVGQASLRGGEIQLSATDSGIPVALRVTADQLRRDPQDVGDDLLRLCRLAAARAGLTRRSYLADLGIPANALELLGLPTQEEVETMELADEVVHDYEPRSLMEPDGSIW